MNPEDYEKQNLRMTMLAVVLIALLLFVGLLAGLRGAP